MYILVEGELSVEKGGIQLGYLTSAGSFFGEVPVLDPQGEKVPRSRTVRAITDCFLVYLERDDVQGLADR
jgi:CRP-like cAMP-binding protein|eukprot:COSAG01_NODE_153_length_23909_cov_32.542018_16_plen_70_part_00